MADGCPRKHKHRLMEMTKKNLGFKNGIQQREVSRTQAEMKK